MSPLEVTINGQKHFVGDREKLFVSHPEGDHLGLLLCGKPVGGDVYTVSSIRELQPGNELVICNSDKITVTPTSE